MLHFHDVSAATIRPTWHVISRTTSCVQFHIIHLLGIKSVSREHIYNSHAIKPCLSCMQYCSSLCFYQCGWYENNNRQTKDTHLTLLWQCSQCCLCLPWFWDICHWDFWGERNFVCGAHSTEKITLKTIQQQHLFPISFFSSLVSHFCINAHT